MSSSTSAKFLALMLLLQILIAVSAKNHSALRKSAIRKAKDFDRKPFLDVVQLWQNIFQKVQGFSDKLFDSVQVDGVVPRDQFLGLIRSIFPKKDEQNEKKDQLQNFFFVKVDKSIEQVHKKDASAAVQNFIVGLTLDLLYTSKFDVLDGPHKKEVEDLVNSTADAHKQFGALTKSIFEQADSNHSNALSLDEFKATYSSLLQPGQDVEAIFKEFDADFSGELDLEEATMVLGKILLEHVPQFHLNN